MNKVTICLFCLFASLTIFGQKNSWVTYFPAQDSIIGQICTGTSVDNLIFFKQTQLPLEYENYQSYSTLDRHQKKSLVLKFGDAFNYEGVKVSSINAENIHVDRIKAENLGAVYPGNQFVYSGLRADKVTIEFKKDKNTTINPKAIAERIGKAFSVDLKKLKI